MLGMPKEALKHLGESKTDTKDTYSVNSTTLQARIPEKLSASSIQMINTAAVKFCSNDLLGAKETLDELLNQLEIKLVT